jgi:CBS-domain-containing membrane protein
MEWLSTTAHYPLAVIPFATSIVLVIGAPEAVPAQPRAPVGGHLVATLVGFAVLWVTGPQAWAAALSNNLPWSFLLAPVLAGVLLLAAFACAWQRWVSHRPWPRHLP